MPECDECGEETERGEWVCQVWLCESCLLPDEQPPYNRSYWNPSGD